MARYSRKAGAWGSKSSTPHCRNHSAVPHQAVAPESAHRAAWAQSGVTATNRGSVVKACCSAAPQPVPGRAELLAHGRGQDAAPSPGDRRPSLQTAQKLAARKRPSDAAYYCQKRRGIATPSRNTASGEVAPGMVRRQAAARQRPPVSIRQIELTSAGASRLVSPACHY